MPSQRKAILIILDGWGIRPDPTFNAITAGRTPHYDVLCRKHPLARLDASGTAVGLPAGVMGNSEVGHMNIGSGRPVQQPQVRINESIREGEFFKIPLLREAMTRAREGNSKLHLIGLVSQGNVHSAELHYLSLVEMARREKVPAGKVFVHALLDGRDTPPKSAERYLQVLEDKLSAAGGKIASVAGRYYTMDRDKRWERIDLGYRALVLGRGETAPDSRSALAGAYRRRETDEFVKPTVIVDTNGEPLAPIVSGDVVICFNFRPDRMRQIVRALTNNDGPVPSLDKSLRIACYTMTRYDPSFTLPTFFPPQDLSRCMGEAISAMGLRQFRTAETEKYAHVTYFLNGGQEEPFEHETRIMIPSPKVATYDLQPEMSSVEVADAVVRRAEAAEDALIVVNFAQPDMVGHTGIFDAAVAAVEATDRCISQVTQAGLDHGYTVFLTADHGNIEMMRDPATGQPHTAHTTNLVPFFLIGSDPKKTGLIEKGAFCDIGPTILQFLHVPLPSQMSGRSLLRKV